MKALVLITHDWNKPFILQTDAQSMGWDVSLAEWPTRREFSIAFVFRKLLPREKNYWDIKWKAQAIVKGVK